MVSLAYFTKDAINILRVTKNADKAHTILLVDDEDLNLRVLVELLEDDYHVLTASDGNKALDLVKNDPNPERIHLIISEQRMSNMTGVEFLKQTIPIIPKTIRMIFTGFFEVDSILNAVNEGKVYKFLAKPLDPEDMLVAIKEALEVYDSRQKQLIGA